MAEYKESSITGRKRMRSYRVIASNPASGARSIQFDEEWLTELDDGRYINEPSGSIRRDFSAPGTEFDLVHPETGAVIGSATYLNVYMLLHSLYMHLATERDNAPPPEPPFEPSPEPE